MSKTDEDYAELLYQALPDEIDAIQATSALSMLLALVIRGACGVSFKRAPSHDEVTRMSGAAEECFKAIRQALIHTPSR